MTRLKTTIQSTNDAGSLKGFAQIIFANADHAAYLVLFAHFDGLRCTFHDRSVFLELTAFGEETIEILFELGLYAGLVRHRALRNAALTTTVTLEDHTMHGVLTALVLCDRRFLGITPHFDEIRTLYRVSGALDLITELAGLLVRFFLTRCGC